MTHPDRHRAFAALAALLTHIGQLADAPPTLAHLPFYRQHTPEMNPADTEAIDRTLGAAWATEYALRTTSELGDPTLLRTGIQWAMPQAKAAIRFGLQAFLYTCGVRLTNTKTVLREAGRLVVKNAYPRALAFYAAGSYDDFSVHRLPFFRWPMSVMFEDNPLLSIHNTLGHALEDVRKLTAQQVRVEVQANPNTTIRNAAGQPLEKWKDTHWQQITWRLGYTTVFDLIDHALQPFESVEQADTCGTELQDPAAWYATLIGVVEALAFVHESYVVRAIGETAYVAIIGGLPAHLQTGFVQQRATTILTPTIA